MVLNEFSIKSGEILLVEDVLEDGDDGLFLGLGHVEVSRIGGVGGIEGLADGGGVGGAVVSGDVITSSDVSSSSGGSDISN